jgi:hypothetical protein
MPGPQIYEKPAAAWEAETAKPLPDRQLFRFREISTWLARHPGRLEWDADEARRIVEDIFDRFERGEFCPADVLVSIAEPPYFVPVHSFIEIARDPEDRTERESEIRTRSIVEWCLMLRRPALELYLGRCGLEGAPRLWRALGFFDRAMSEHVAQPASASAAIPEAAQLKAGAPSKRRPGKPGPEPTLRTIIANTMFDDLRSERRTPEELRGDTLAALVQQYRGSPNTAKAAREAALARFAKFAEMQS